MSRTRIVRGKITEVVEKDYDIFSESNIVDNAADMVTDKGGNKGVTYNNPSRPSAGEIRAKVMVEFRPHNNWTGSFGFDWIRFGDTGLSGDVFYKSIVGKNRDAAGNISQRTNYGSNIVADESEYRDLLKKYTLMKVNFTNDFYVIPWLSLYKGKTAKLSLKINIKEPPKKIEFKYDTNLFKLNRTEISQKSKGKHTLADYLQITCINTFNQDKFVEVLADGEIVGKLKVHKNGKVDRKKLDVLLVPVKTNIKLPGGETGNVTDENNKLKKYLGQALITPNVKISGNLDITNNATFRQRFVRRNQIVYSGHDLHDYMLTTYNFRRHFPNHFIIYVFDVRALSGGFSAGGEAYDINSDNALVFEYASRKTTCLVHELLHALGLYHTFDNDSLFTFPKVTENIMDYTNPRYATFKWQWDIIRKNTLVKPE
ncbi:hypothetical protein ACLB9Y_03070 [Chryseobacterium scophthalmum]|uniref:hypothetical protein n=1 Tax=Chryseobacterium scophthalmum TaxID=59733 RepID=UPI00398B3550